MLANWFNSKRFSKLKTIVLCWVLLMFAIYRKLLNTFTLILFRFFILWLSSLIGWNRTEQLIKLIGSNKKRISWASENLTILKTLDMLLYQTFLSLSTAKYKIWITKSKTRRILYLYRVSFFTVKIALHEDSCSRKKKDLLPETPRLPTSTI